METGYSNTTKTFTIIRTNGMMVSQTNLPLYNRKLKMVAPYSNMRTLNIRCDAEIGQAAFLGCPELRDIHGEGVTSIGGMAFGCCPYLKYADFSKNPLRRYGGISRSASRNATYSDFAASIPLLTAYPLPLLSS